MRAQPAREGAGGAQQRARRGPPALSVSPAGPPPPPPSRPLLPLPLPDARLSLLSKRAAAVASAASKRAETAPAVPGAAVAAAWSTAGWQGERVTPPKRRADPGRRRGAAALAKHCEA
eukprot:tig00021587_g22705.t1